MKSFVDLFEEQAEKNPNQALYVEYQENGQHVETTFAQMKDKLCGYARTIDNLGISGYGDRVLLVFQSAVEFMAALLACHYTGSIPVPLEMVREHSDLTRWENYAGNANARCVLTSYDQQEAMERIFAKSARLKAVPIYSPTVGAHAPVRQPLHETGVILYTSGSTGSPKGVVITQEGLLLNVGAYCAKIGAAKESVFVSWMPYQHCMGLVTSLLTGLYHGSLMVLIQGKAFIENPFIWIKAMSDYRANVSICSNFALKMTTQAIRDASEEQLNDIDLAAMQTILAGGETMNVNTWLEFYNACKSLNLKKNVVSFGYGQTEATACISIYAQDKRMSWINVDREKLGKGELIIVGKGRFVDLEGQLTVKDNEIVLTGNGTRLDQHQVFVVNQQGEDAGVLQIGEIVFAGPSMSKGYLDNPEATEALFGRTSSGITYIKTGDIGFIDEHGEVFLTGRKKDVMIIGGINYYPDDIEAIVNQVMGSDSIYGGCAFSIAGPTHEEIVIVKETQPHTVDTFQALADEINKQLIVNVGLIPQSIIFVGAYTLERTGSGKVKRSQTKQLFMNGLLEAVHYKWLAKQEVVGNQSGQLQNIITHIISSKAGMAVDELSPDMLFTKLGLGSLMLLEIVDRLKVETGVYIPIAELFEQNSIRKLTTYIENKQKEAVQM